MALMAFMALGLLPGAEAATVKQMVWVEAKGGLYQIDAASRSLVRQVPLSNAVRGLVADSTGGAWVALDGVVDTSKHGRLRRVDADGAIRADVDMKNVGLAKGEYTADLSRLLMAPDLADGGVWAIRAYQASSTDSYSFTLVRLSAAGEVVLRTTVTVPGGDVPSSLLVGRDRNLLLQFGIKKAVHLSATGSITGTTLLESINAPPYAFEPTVDAETESAWSLLPSSAGPRLVRLSLAPSSPTQQQSIPMEAPCASMGVDPAAGFLWGVCGNFIRRLDPADGVPPISFNWRDRGMLFPRVIGVAAHTDEVWLSTISGVYAFSNAGEQRAVLPSITAATRLSITPADIRPSIEVIEPPAGHHTNDARPPITLAYANRCGERACTMADGRFSVPRLTATLNGTSIEAAFTHDAATRRAAFIPAASLADGEHAFTAAASDRFGRRSDPVEAKFTVDTQAPQVAQLAPPDGSRTSQSQLRLTGTLAEPGIVTLGSHTQQGPAFSFDVGLLPGPNQVVLTAADVAGNKAQVSLTYHYLTVAISAPADGATVDTPTITVSGSFTGPADTVVAVNGLAATINGSSYRVDVPLVIGANVLNVTATSGGVTATRAISVQRREGGGSGPNLNAPPTDPTTSTIVGKSTEFLYTGANPVQVGVQPGTIEARRAAVVRGKVTDRAGNPLSGVKVQIHQHAQYGHTLTRADGLFDMAVNGGVALTLNYTKSGHLPVQRRVIPIRLDYTMVDAVAMTPLDPNVTSIDLNATAEIQVARGGLSVDTDGSRRATILVPKGTTAMLEMPDGSVRPLQTLSMRATEYTVGPRGVQAMPGALPPSSAYTYAVELSVDEAITANADTVRFSRPLPVYIENFLGFPVGGAVPLGYYDRTLARWVAAKNGKVIKIVATGPDGAQIDLNGDDQPETAAQLEELGITPGERASLATLYSAGTSLWRAPIDHFTPWDCNWPFGPPNDAKPPKSTFGKYGEDTCDEECGSIIDVQNSVLREKIDVVGAPFSLYYSSRDSNGAQPEATIEIPLTGPDVPPSLKRVDLEVHVAGTVKLMSFAVAPNLKHKFAWDGMDAYGRPVHNSFQTTKVRIGYVYEGRYYTPSDFAASFAELASVPITGSRTRNEVTLWQELATQLRYNDSSFLGFGGWMPSIVHRYDPIAQTLHYGDGTRLSGVSGTASLWTVAGNGTRGHSGDGGPATAAQLTNPLAMASDGKGNLVIADGHRIRRVRSDGTIETIAGGSTSGFSGDEGPAVSALLELPQGVAIDPSGNIWVSDTGNHRVRMITPDGMIRTVVGSGTPAPMFRTQFDALAAPIGFPRGIAITKAGEVFIAATGSGGGGTAVLRVSPDLKRVTNIGGGYGAPVELAADSQGNLAIVNQSSSNTIHLLGIDGSLKQLPLDQWGIVTNVLYIGDTLYFTTLNGQRIQRWNGDGTMTVLAGTGLFQGATTEGAPATGSKVTGIQALAFDGDSLLYASNFENNVRRLATALPLYSAASFSIPSRDGSQAFEFDATGRHQRTIDALRGSVLFSFEWDTQGRLVKVTDANGRATLFRRNAQGQISGIASADGRITTVGINSDGLLASVADPVGQTHRMEYDELRLTRFERPRGFASTMQYDADGLLIEDIDALGNAKTLSRNVINARDYEMTSRSPEGVIQRYKIEHLVTHGEVRRTNTSATGLTNIVVRGSNGITTTTHADGTVVAETEAPDVRFGMLAPVVGKTTRLPSGLVMTTTASRLRASGDVTETTTVNGKPYKAQFSKLTGEIVFTSPLGRKRTIATDAVGRPTRVHIDGLDSYSFEYDARGRARRVVLGEGIAQRSIDYTYDADGLKTATDSAGQSVEYQRDLAGRVEQVVLPGARVVVLGADPNGNLRGVTPPGQPRHALEYNPLDLETAYAPPTLPGLPDATTRVQYNRDRQITHWHSPDGNSIVFGYEPAKGRLTSLTPSAGAGNAITFGYSPTSGYLTEIGTVDAALAQTYDGPLLKSVAIIGTVPGSIAWTYDNNFRVTSKSVNGTSTAFTYDDDGLLTRAGQLTFTRHPQHGAVSATALGSIATGQTYTGFGEPHVFTAIRGGSTLYRNELGYDRAGRIVSRKETVGGQEVQYEYGYDAAGRLATVKRNGVQAASYGYDANGNRTHVNGLAVATFDAQDRIQQQGAASYEFTANGALQRKTQGAQGTSYVYDAFGNLRKVTLPVGQIEYLADGLNRRIGKKVNGTLVQGFVYEDTLRVAAELDGGGAVIARFSYGLRPNVPEYMDKGGVTYRVVTDHLGSVRLVVNAASGDVAQRIDYDEWGQVTSDSNPGFQPFGYAGGLQDKDTGLVRFGARDYDPQVGRWTAKDPIRFRGGDSNLYAYVGGDPIAFFDPTGRVKITGIPGASGETSVHANPGPNASSFRPEHGPDHVHLGGNDGPRVKTSDFQPMSDADAMKMSRKQRKFCEGLSNESKDQIRRQQRNVFDHGTTEAPELRPRVPIPPIPGLLPLICPACSIIYPNGPGGDLGGLQG